MDGAPIKIKDDPAYDTDPRPTRWLELRAKAHGLPPTASAQDLDAFFQCLGGEAIHQEILEESSGQDDRRADQDRGGGKEGLDFRFFGSLAHLGFRRLFKEQGHNHPQIVVDGHQAGGNSQHR